MVLWAGHFAIRTQNMHIFYSFADFYELLSLRQLISYCLLLY